MARFAKLTNQTRAIIRPPMWDRPASAKLLAELLRVYSQAQPAHKQARQQKAAQAKQKPVQKSLRPVQSQPENQPRGPLHQGPAKAAGNPANAAPRPAQASQAAQRQPGEQVKKSQPAQPTANTPPARVPPSPSYFTKNGASPSGSSPNGSPSNGSPSAGSPRQPAPARQPWTGSPQPPGPRLPASPPVSNSTQPANQARYRTDRSGMPPVRKPAGNQPNGTNGASHLPLQMPLGSTALPGSSNGSDLPKHQNGNGLPKNGSSLNPAGLPSNGAGQVHPAVPGANGASVPAAGPEQRPSHRPPAPRSLQPVSRPQAASLERILELHPEFPLETALLGVCQDGLPVLLDLNDPAPGALLLVGDERDKHIEILRSAVTSTVKRNTPRTVQFLVLTDDPSAWLAWVKQRGYGRHCITVEKADSEMAREWIMRLADWTEQRRMGQRSGPSVLLVMDSLNFLPRLPYDVRLNFDWMVKEAPPARIWPMASITTNLALSLSGRMLRPFQSRILGYSCDPAVYVRLGEVEGDQAEAFSKPGEFAIKLGEDWLRFQSPGK